MRAIGYRKTAALLSASSVWGIEEQAKWKKDNLWPYTDPYYPNVSLLLPMTGANNSTTFTDVSYAPKTVTRYGDAKISTTQSKWGNGGGYFDGSGDYLSIANTAALNLASASAWTVECWVYPLDSRTYAALIAKRSGSNPTSYQFYRNNGKIGFYNGTVYQQSGTVLDNRWTHLAWVFNAGNLKIFVDGSQDGNWNSVALSEVDMEIEIGRHYSSLEEAFYGYLQDLRITKGIARYTANFTPPTAAFYAG